MEEVRETKKVKAQIENGRAEDYRQSWRLERRGWRRPKPPLKEIGPDKGRRNFYFPQSHYDEYTPLNY